MKIKIEVTFNTGEYHLVLDAIRMRQKGCKPGSHQWKKLDALWLKIFCQASSQWKVGSP